MSFDDFYKRFTAFGLAFALGLFAAAFLYGLGLSGVFKSESKPAPKIAVSTSADYSASGGPGHSRDDSQNLRDQTSQKSDSKLQPTAGVKILTKPRANYTPEARTNNIQGKVVLRVVFGANGAINAISVVNGLPDGLTERAIEAAKGIKFEPAKRGGVPYTVTKPVEYTFTIY